MVKVKRSIKIGDVKDMELAADTIMNTIVEANKSLPNIHTNGDDLKYLIKMTKRLTQFSVHSTQQVLENAYDAIFKNKRTKTEVVVKPNTRGIEYTFGKFGIGNRYKGGKSTPRDLEDISDLSKETFEELCKGIANFDKANIFVKKLKQLRKRYKQVDKRNKERDEIEYVPNKKFKFIKDESVCRIEKIILKRGTRWNASVEIEAEVWDYDYSDDENRYEKSSWTNEVTLFRADGDGEIFVNKLLNKIDLSEIVNDIKELEVELAELEKVGGEVRTEFGAVLALAEL